jgi:ABC-2 type transport system ATP-binding protein
MPGSNEPVAVTVRGLEKRFGEFVAVNGISLDVARGEIFGFLGPNGAGKSTTIRMLTGLLAPTAGSGTVAGFDVVTQAEQIKTRIGYMSQKFSLYEDLTVEENISFYSGIYRLPADKKRERKEWVLRMAGLEQHRKTRTAHLSGGWKQRLALGCAILHEPPVVFLDEPTSGVDPLSRRAFWDLIYGLSEQGVTVFVTTHYMEEAEYCDRLGLVYRGELVALGTPAELKATSVRGAVLEVACDRAQDALPTLEAVPGVREAAMFGSTIHVVADEDAELTARVESALSGAGFAASRVERITPSLEDVFVALIEASDRRVQPLAEVAR